MRRGYLWPQIPNLQFDQDSSYIWGLKTNLFILRGKKGSAANQKRETKDPLGHVKSKSPVI